MSHTPSRLLGRIATLGTVGTALATGLMLGAPGGAMAATASHATASHGFGHHDTAAGGSSAVHYTCTGALGPIKLAVDADLGDFDDAVDGSPTGLHLGQGVSVQLSVDFNDNAFGSLLGGAGGLGGLGGLLGGGLMGGSGSGSASGLLGQLGGLSLGFGQADLPLAGLTDQVSHATTDPSLDGDTSTGGFTLPDPGSYDISLPQSFSFAPLTILGIKLFSMDCHQTTGSPVVDTVDVDQQTSDTDATDTSDTSDTSDPSDTGSSDHSGDLTLVTQVLRQLGGKASGTVVALAGGHPVGRGALHGGRSTLHLHGLSPRTKTVTVRYLGNRTTKASSAVVHLKRH